MGQQTPSENRIIEKYKVSNTTARKALHEIEKAGWVKRIKGRGTYVCRNSVGRSINRILGFTRNMLEEGRVPSTKVIDVRIMRSSHSVAIRGRRYTLKGPLCRIQRIRFADGAAMMKETRYISTKFCPGIEKKDLEGSLYEIYSTEYGICLERASQMLSAVMLNGDNLETFRLDKPIPAFYVEGVTFCGRELVVEMEKSIYRGDMYRFFVEAC
jgi:GntR family transcriptional regulator